MFLPCACLVLLLSCPSLWLICLLYCLFSLCICVGPGIFCIHGAMSVVCRQWSFLSSFFEGCLCPKGHACMLLVLSVCFFSGIVFCWLSCYILVFLYVHCYSVISISGWFSNHTCAVPVVLPLNHQVKQYIGFGYLLCICYVAILVLFIYFVFVLYAYCWAIGL